MKKTIKLSKKKKEELQELNNWFQIELVKLQKREKEIINSYEKKLIDKIRKDI
ncbi:MAG: hypothetical protein WC752_01570 [Patescibacteria group bacterium]|jgi:hypothetical protein